MTTFRVPQEMKSFWGEFWCGPEEIPQKEATPIAFYKRHGKEEIAAQVAALIAGDEITYTVCSNGRCVRTPSRMHAVDLCRWLQFGEIQFVA